MTAFRVEEYPYLIIGGAPKAGTTSLYKWLADHPGVCASSIKETRFFLDADYPLPRANAFMGNNLEEYAGFFRHCQNARPLIRVDVTPDYLYSNTALRISELLPSAKIVFIMRDPVERMVSWYKYARQRGMICKEMTFHAYVMGQVGRHVTGDTPIHLRALDQCRHETYIKPFKEAFGKRCMILDFNDLKTDPLNVMRRICDFSSLDESFYNSYTFQAENVSQEARSRWIMRGYTWTRRSLAFSLHDKPIIVSLLKKPNAMVKRMLFGEQRKAGEIQISDELRMIITQHSESN